ncbi:MAG: helix-hairpin-helix domain-containing protein, partial [Eubacterium sp.]|nr:helix-hairpin-helix domain-containing protein [Eubacterium sp.]
AYREHLGGYTSVEQLKNISGIGDAVYASIAPYVTVR